MVLGLDTLFDTFRSRRLTTTEGVRPEEPREIGQGESQRVVGHTGTAVYGGYIVEDEKNNNLTRRRKYKTYSEILANVAIVSAGVRLFLNVVAKAQWNVEPAMDTEEIPEPPPRPVQPDQIIAELDPPPPEPPAEPTLVSSPEAQEIAEKIQDMMNDMDTPWARVIRRAAMYRFYGFSIQEWTAKLREEDGLIGMRDIAPRPQLTIERWDMDITGSILGVVQRSEQDGQEIYLPRNKLVYMVDDSLNDSPEGLGLFRHIVESVQRLRRYLELEGFAFETDLRGIPVGRIPFAELDAMVQQGILSEEEKQNRINGMQEFIKKHIKNPQLGIILDSAPYRSIDDAATPSTHPMWDIELLTGDGSNNGQESILNAIERELRQIARIMGVDQLLLGDGDRGSFALSQDKSHSFSLIIDSVLNELTEAFQKDFIGPLMKMNGWDPAMEPRLKTEPIQFRDVEQIVTAIRELSTAGIGLHPEDEAVGEIFDIIGLSKPDATLAERTMLEDRALGMTMAENALRMQEQEAAANNQPPAGE